MNDIQSRKDIEILVDSFYKKLLQDDSLKHFFTTVIQLNLKEHLPTICDFWESILLDNMVYRGNPMIKHIELHKKSSLHPEHFESWLAHWNKTLTDLHTGPKVDEAMKRAKLMADLMQFKIKQSEDKNFIQ